MEKILQASSTIPAAGRFIAYGTAGFRTLASDLHQVFFRSGLIALLRAFETEKFVGIMVTASHNHIRDNGLKMVDFNGEMIPIVWEKKAEELANALDLRAELEKIWPKDKKNGKVLIGADNRPSSQELVDCIKLAINSAECEFHDYGVITTPQLHFLVNESNREGAVVGSGVYVEGLRGKVAKLFEEFCGGDRYEGGLQLDCAGGVGMGVMKELGFEWVKLVNLNPEQLNHECGAEFAHKDRRLPVGMELGVKSASFDGDADRLVYYKSAEQLSVLGGERLTVLYATALKRLLSQTSSDTKITVVTTGYSNSASILYLESQGIKSIIVPTGVKYLHQEAHHHDISIYFESNGHGTILHKPELISSLHPLVQSYLQLANTTVGDAVADLLLAEVSLRILDWSLDDWLSIYEDLPNIMIAVRSEKKDLIKNSWDQLEVLEPAELASSITNIIQSYTSFNARTLVRPSGTEPIVRIYVESTSLSTCHEISEKISSLL